MISLIILLVNFISAVLTIIAWLKKPEKKVYAIIGLICGLISVATTQFTIISIIMLSIFVFIVIMIYSVKVYAGYEHEIVQAQVLFNDPSRKEIMDLAQNIFEKPIYNLTETAKAIKFAASKGVQYSEIKELINISGKLSIAIQADFIRSVDILIKLKRMFNINTGYELIADKITVTSQNGVPLAELIEVTDTYLQECYMPNLIKIEEYLAAIVTFTKTELRGVAAGKSLAALINELSGDSGKLKSKLAELDK